MTTKHVQAELDEDEYKTFRRSVEERGMTVREAGHEALIDWAERQQRVDPYDKAFTILDELDNESLPETADTDAREESDIVEEWSGEDTDFTLAPDPPSQDQDQYEDQE